MYKKHLQRGVTKGALTQEQADAKLESWLADKQKKIDAAKEAADKEIVEFRKIVAGEVKAANAPKRDEEAEAAFREGANEDAPSEEATEAAAQVEPTAEAAGEEE